MSKILFIIDDAPYGTEKAYNALRMSMTSQKEDEAAEVRIFLMADAATAAMPNQNTPQGYYNIERMIKSGLMKGGKVEICETYAEARGMKDLKLIDGTEHSTMKGLAQLTLDGDETLAF